MSPLKREARQKAPPIVVKVRRIKHTNRPATRLLARRAATPSDPERPHA